MHSCLNFFFFCWTVPNINSQKSIRKNVIPESRTCRKTDLVSPYLTTRYPLPSPPPPPPPVDPDLPPLGLRPFPHGVINTTTSPRSYTVLWQRNYSDQMAMLSFSRRVHKPSRQSPQHFPPSRRIRFQWTKIFNQRICMVLKRNVVHPNSLLKLYSHLWLTQIILGS